MKPMSHLGGCMLGGCQGGFLVGQGGANLYSVEVSSGLLLAIVFRQ
jgi:hypothetical protein